MREPAKQRACDESLADHDTTTAIGRSTATQRYRSCGSSAEHETLDASWESGGTVQLKADSHSGLDDEGVRRAAGAGISDAGQPLPYLETIQRSFGRHDVSNVRAHFGSRASEANAALGSHAYATGNDIAFASSSPSLHLVAHEAAHVVQQRAGVRLSSAVGQAGDSYEQQADAVADAVVRGQSAEQILEASAGAPGDTAIQRKAAPKPPKPLATGWKEAGHGRERKDGAWSDKTPDKRRPVKQESKSDLTPAIVARWNDDWKLMCEAKSKAISDWFVHTLGMGESAPSVAMTLVASINSAKGNVAATKDEEAAGAKGPAAPQISAALAGTFSIGYGKLYESKPRAYSASLLNEQLTGEVIPGLLASIGVSLNAAADVKVSSEALQIAERLLTGWEGLARATAKEATAPDNIPTVDRSKGVPKLADTSIKERPVKDTTASGLGGSVSVGGFAGVKLGGSLKANLRWSKQSGADYAKAVTHFVRSGKHVPPDLQALLVFLIDQSKGLADVLLGPAGNVVLASISGAAGVGAGVGATGKAEAGWSTTRGFTFTLEGSLYWGLGGEISTLVSVNPIDAIRLAIILAAKAEGYLIELEQKAGSEVSRFLDGISGQLGEFMDWLDADNKVRKAVALGAHRAMTAEQRAKAIATLLDPACFGASELAIIDILDASKQKGDLAHVLSRVDVPTLLSKVDGAEDSMIRNFLTVGDKSTYTVSYGVFSKATAAMIEHRQLWVRTTSPADHAAYSWTSAADWTSKKYDSWMVIVEPSKARHATVANGYVRAEYASHSDAREDQQNAKQPGAIRAGS